MPRRSSRRARSGHAPRSDTAAAAGCRSLRCDTTSPPLFAPSRAWSPRRAADFRALSDLLVPETIRRPIEPQQIHALRLRARPAARDDDALAGREGGGGDANRRQLAAVVHLELPALRAALGRDVDEEEWMRINQLKVRDGAVERRAASAVVERADRVMRLQREREEQKCRREREAPASEAELFKADHFLVKV